MGLHVVALDIEPEKLSLARAAGADAAIDARSPDAIADVLRTTGGGACRPPTGDFPTPIFDVVLKRITVRGSIVGTRRDLDEAIAFAVEGKVRADITKAPLEDINTIFGNLRAGKVEVAWSRPF